MSHCFSFLLLFCSTYSLAQELKLYDPAPDPRISEREQLNRARTWLNCYCVDGSHATQFGKPAMLSVDDPFARNCRDWYRSSRYNLAIDVHLVAYVELLRKMGHFKKDVAAPKLGVVRNTTVSNTTSFRPHVQDKILDIVWHYHGELSNLYREWSKRFDDHPQADGQLSLIPCMDWMLKSVVQRTCADIVRIYTGCELLVFM